MSCTIQREIGTAKRCNKTTLLCAVLLLLRICQRLDCLPLAHPRIEWVHPAGNTCPHHTFGPCPPLFLSVHQGVPRQGLGMITALAFVYRPAYANHFVSPSNALSLQ